MSSSSAVSWTNSSAVSSLPASWLYSICLGLCWRTARGIARVFPTQRTPRDGCRMAPLPAAALARSPECWRWIGGGPGFDSLERRFPPAVLAPGPPVHKGWTDIKVENSINWRKRSNGDYLVHSTDPLTIKQKISKPEDLKCPPKIVGTGCSHQKIYFKQFDSTKYTGSI